MPGFRVGKKARNDILDIGRYTQKEWGAAQRRAYLSGLDKNSASLPRIRNARRSGWNSNRR